MEHAVSFNFRLVWTFNIPVHVKGMLLVPALLEREVCCTSTIIPLKTAVLPSKMAHTTSMT